MIPSFGWNNIFRKEPGSTFQDRAASRNRLGEYRSVFASRASLGFFVAIAGLAVLLPREAAAQWWSRAPADFEECAETAERAATKADKTAALAECNAKFAGRRKPGGGYSYYDFMQDRSFDIAGPNPTPEEQKRIDEQYTVYLEKQRRNSIADAFSAKQQEQFEQASLRSKPERVPVPLERPKSLAATAADRAKAISCAKDKFSCDWPRLSETLNDLKKLFTASPSKAKRS